MTQRCTAVPHRRVLQAGRDPGVNPGADRLIDALCRIVIELWDRDVVVLLVRPPGQRGSDTALVIATRPLRQVHINTSPASARVIFSGRPSPHR